MLGRKKSFPKPQLVHFAELCSKNEALCLMWRAEVGTSAEGFKVNPGPWPAPAPASPGSLQFPPAAIPGCCQAPSWPPSGHLAPIPGRRRRRPRSICTNSRSTAQRPLCHNCVYGLHRFLVDEMEFNVIGVCCWDRWILLRWLGFRRVLEVYF